MKKLLLALFAALITLAVTLPGVAGTRDREFAAETFHYPAAAWTELRDINNRGEMVGIAAWWAARPLRLLQGGAHCR